jgi:class 3 adenylate cyclase
MAPHPSSKRIQRLITLIIIGANMLGATLTFVYYNVFAPLPQGGAAVSSIAPYAIYVFLGGMVVLFFSAFMVTPRLFNLRDEIIWRWYNSHSQGDPTPAPAEVRNQALNFVPRYTGVVFTTWILAWVLFGPIQSWLGVIGTMTGSDMMQSIIGTVVVGGVLTSAVCYFLLDAVWRPQLEIFFPEGKLSTEKAFHFSVRRRLLVVFLLIGLWPINILANAALNRAHDLLVASNPQTVLDNLSWMIIFIVTISLIVSVGMAIFTTRSIVGPIKTLMAAMQRVGQNDLNAKVPVTTNDELGYLAEGFNAMTAGLRQGELLRNLLNLYVSPEVARAAVERGVKLGGEQVECTVLFSDIRGFTSLSEQLPPAELIALLNHYMSAMVAVIVERGGIVNKFGGDSLLALFGTPLNPDADHALRAVQAAANMRSALAEFNRGQANQSGPQLAIGIGIATGFVVAGNVGGEGRIEYTVIGDTVNLASRLQSMTKELGHDTLLSADTFVAAQKFGTIRAEALPAVTVRGKKETVAVYALERP